MTEFSHGNEPEEEFKSVMPVPDSYDTKEKRYFEMFDIMNEDQ